MQGDRHEDTETTAMTDTQTPEEREAAIRASVVSINRGRAYASTDGYVHYLDRQAPEDAAKDPINRLLNFIKRHLLRQR